MNKKFSLTFAALFPLTLYAQLVSADLSDAAAKALDAVVQVQSFVSDSAWNNRPGVTSLDNKSSRSNKGYLTGNASGVIVSASGQIITNAHVIAGGDSLIVILPDRRSYTAVLVGMDIVTDLALLQIKAEGLSFLEVGDPNLLRIGEPVLAIGNPLDLNSTVTAGILSARYRSMDDPINTSLMNSYLQTDAASNEGMSGSALVDRNGKLIGINAAILSPSGTFAGYAFAIPAGVVKKAITELTGKGYVQHAGLDMDFSDMDASMALSLHAKTPNGVLVDDLEKGGAADRSGLRKNDIILQVDRQQVNSAAQLRELLAQHSPGDSILLTLSRQGVEVDIPAVLRPFDERNAGMGWKRQGDGATRRTSRH